MNNIMMAASPPLPKHSPGFKTDNGDANLSCVTNVDPIPLLENPDCGVPKRNEYGHGMPEKIREESAKKKMEGREAQGSRILVRGGGQRGVESMSTREPLLHTLSGLYPTRTK